MNEILDLQPEGQKAIVKLEVGQIFRPFEGINEFPAVELDHETDEEIIRLVAK